MKKEESRDFDVFLVFGGGKKGSEFIQAESKTKEVFFFFFFGLEGAWGLL